MAIPILNHLDVKGNIGLNDNKLEDFVVDHSTTSDAGNTAGKLIYDSGTLKYYDGANGQWQSIGTSSGSMSQFILEDDDGTEVSISNNEEVKFIGSGITTNWTDTSDGSDADPFDLTFTIDAAQTGITSIYNTSLIIGRQADGGDGNGEWIDFGNDGRITLRVDGGEARWNGSAFIPGTDNGADLGSSSKEWKDLYIDGTAYVDAISLDGTAISCTAAELNILDGVTATASELNILDGVTSTTAELNILDGVTATASELNIMDGVTSTTAELNILDGVTATTAELNILDGVTSTAAELNVLDGFTGDVTDLNYAKTLYDTGVTGTEFDYLDGVTSNIQTQLDSKGTSNLALGTTSSTAMAGDTTVDNVSVANLKTKLAGGFGSNAVTIGDSNDVVTIGNDLIITGDLTVSGDTITANVGTLDVEDKNITINKGSGDTSSTADGAGITIQDAVDASNDASLTWNASNDKFVFSHLIDAPGTSIFVNLDVSGDVDVDGTLETDALSINGTAVSATAAELNIMDGVTSTTAELNILDGVTSTTAELNILDGVTSTTAELNILDGVTATASEINKLDGVTATTSELNILDGVTSTATELNLLDGITTLSGSNTGDESAASTSASGIVELATAAEVKTGTDASRAVTPDTLAAKSITATIDVSSLDSTQKKALIDHDLGTPNVIVECHGLTSKEVVICEYHKDNNGSASDDHLTFHFAAVPSEDIVVTVTSAKGATSITPTYPTS